MGKGLQHIINSGEDEKVEFKTSFGKEVIESVVAFANTKGGQIIIGVNNNKKLVGVSVSDESTQNWINQIKQNTYPQVIPDVEHFVLEGKNVIVLTVLEYPVKPVSFKNKYLKRVKNSNHLLSVNEIADEHLRTINSSWDFYPDSNHSINDISEDKVKRFIKTIEKRNLRAHSEISPGI